MLARPLILLLLLGLPLWWWLRRRQRRPAARYSDVTQITSVSNNRRWIGEGPAALRSLAIGCWVVAAAGPRVALQPNEITREGISIVLAVDVSSSMLAEDFTPSNRLDVAKEQSKSFIRARQFDRIGLVAFAGEALTLVPVTVDYPVLEVAIDSLDIGQLEDGTAIGTAIATAANRLRRVPGESKVIVLLTDGDNNRGRIDPRTAAEAAGELGMRIYTIGIGTDGEARTPIGTGVGGRVRYQTLPVRLDEVLLRDVAEGTGGRYFRATDAEALSRIFQQIDQLERTPVQITRFTEHNEAYRIPVIIGLVALAMELVMSATMVVRVP
jgi:Ca-activated chloride channel family protein